MDPWVKGYAKATLWLKNEGYPSKRIKQLGSLAEAVQAQESRRRTRERTCCIYICIRRTECLKRIGGAGRNLLLTLSLLRSREVPPPRTKEVTLTFRVGPGRG